MREREHLQAVQAPELRREAAREGVVREVQPPEAPALRGIDPSGPNILARKLRTNGTGKGYV